MPLRSLVSALLAASVAAGCTGGGSDKSAPPSAPDTPVRADAGAVPPPIDAGVTVVPTFDPASGFHLDDDMPPTRPGTRIAARDRKPVQLLLRSTPAGAIAAVDGERLGPTPVLWEGVVDGLPHEVWFAMAGHSLARYKFVPVTSGIVHGTLVKVTDDQDAGVPDIPGARVDAGVPERPAPPRIDAGLPIDAAPPADASDQDGL